MIRECRIIVEMVFSEGRGANMHEESQVRTREASNLGNGSTSNFVGPENGPYCADRDPPKPVLQIAGTPGDRTVLGKLCHMLS